MAFFEEFRLQDIFNAALAVGADPQKCLNLIDFADRWHNDIPVLDSRDQGRVSVISSIKDGLFAVSFHNRKGEDSASWSSFDSSVQQELGCHTWTPCENKLNHEEYKSELHKQYLNLHAEATTYPQDSFPYLQAKQLTGVTGIPMIRDFATGREGQHCLAVIMEKDGEKVGLQRIYADGKKSFIPGSKVKGAHHFIKATKEKDPEAKSIAYVAEGIATALTINKLTGEDVYCSFGASNIATVTYGLIAKYEKIIVAADNDKWDARVGNIGLSSVLELAEAKGIQVRYPVFDAKKIGEQKPTDFNDLYCIEGGETALKQLTKCHTSILKAPRKKLDKHLARLTYCGQSEKAVETVIKPCVAAFVEDCFSEDECIQEMKLANGYIDKDLVRHIYSTMGASHNKRVSRCHTIDPSKHPDVKFIKAQLVKQDHGGYSIPENFYEQIADCKGIVIINSPMGSGKTERVMKRALDGAGRGAYIAHRSALVEEGCNRMKIPSYRDRNLNVKETEKLGCCVNSITNPKFGNGRWFIGLDICCVDEITKVLHHVTHAPVNNPEGVVNTLFKVINSSDQVIMNDADANDSLIWTLQKNSKQKITVVQFELPQNDTNVTLTTLENAFRYIRDKAPRKKGLCAFDSKRDIEKTRLHFAERYPEARVLTVTSETKGEPEVAEWIKNPNKQSHKYDLVLFNSAVDSGISITTNYFDFHVGMFRGIVTPESVIQMMGRNRTSREWVLGCSPMKKSCFGDQVKHCISALNAADAALSSEISASAEESNLEESEEKEVDEDDPSLTLFDLIKLSVRRDEILSRKDYKLTLKIMLEQKGYKVHMKEVNQEADKIERKILKKLGDEVKELEIKNIMEAITPTKEEYLELKGSYFLSKKEKSQIDRYEIYQNLCVSEITEGAVKFWKHSQRHEYTFENFQSDEKKITDHSTWEAENIESKTLRKNLRIKFYILRELFNILEIDINTGKGKYDYAKCKEFVEFLYLNGLVYIWNLFELGIFLAANKEPRNPVRVVESCFKRMGLVCESQKIEGKFKHWIGSSEWNTIQEYVNLREKFDQNIANIDSKERDISEIINAEKLKRVDDLSDKLKETVESLIKYSDSPEDAEAIEKLRKLIEQNSEESQDPDDDPDPDPDASEPVPAEEDSVESVGAEAAGDVETVTSQSSSELAVPENSPAEINAKPITELGANDDLDTNSAEAVPGKEDKLVGVPELDSAFVDTKKTAFDKFSGYDLSPKGEIADQDVGQPSSEVASYPAGSDATEAEGVTAGVENALEQDGDEVISHCGELTEKSDSEFYRFLAVRARLDVEKLTQDDLGLMSKIRLERIDLEKYSPNVDYHSSKLANDNEHDCCRDSGIGHCGVGSTPGLKSPDEEFPLESNENDGCSDGGVCDSYVAESTSVSEPEPGSSPVTKEDEPEKEEYYFWRDYKMPYDEYGNAMVQDDYNSVYYAARNGLEIPRDLFIKHMSFDPPDWVNVKAE